MLALMSGCLAKQELACPAFLQLLGIVQNGRVPVSTLLQAFLFVSEIMCKASLLSVVIAQKNCAERRLDSDRVDAGENFTLVPT